MDVILIAGLWLDGSAWADVATELERLGHSPIPVTLPGQGAGSASATLPDQASAVVAAIDSATDLAGAPVVVVGHSAAVSLAWIAADRRPTDLRRVVLIGGFPKASGELYADFFETVDGVMPFPGWDEFDGPDSADIDEPTRNRMAADAIPVPETVTHGIVGLSDQRRFDVPITLICPEFSTDDAKGWVDAGDVPELAAARDVSYVDIDSGHWPMFTRPVDLAAMLDELARLD
jgi:pimeloyl-ACP methyl ester carboxylesterase